MTQIPKLISNGYFGDSPYIMSEYIEYSLDEYIKLKEYPEKTPFSMICVQMI
jgi:hypothetical protein